MTLEDATLIAEASDGEVELYKDYSGRGMYGERTSGVTGSRSNILAAAAEVAAEKGADFAKRLRGLRWDSMGRDEIAY